MLGAEPATEGKEAGPFYFSDRLGGTRHNKILIRCTLSDSTARETWC
ncbi:MAG: hypothetical protein EWM72_01596 [Nitrospira sp.]|nr:MAG: hypothetical protein EWM72_01596 [Nitrospira sp.]